MKLNRNMLFAGLAVLSLLEYNKFQAGLLFLIEMTACIYTLPIILTDGLYMAI